MSIIIISSTKSSRDRASEAKTEFVLKESEIIGREPFADRDGCKQMSYVYNFLRTERSDPPAYSPAGSQYPSKQRLA
jgi:hypothetical protein